MTRGCHDTHVFFGTLHYFSRKSHDAEQTTPTLQIQVPGVAEAGASSHTLVDPRRSHKFTQRFQ